ncbi:Hypothetical predicted protein [Olea europaea subsp. europaea]|uniref:Uncharacterized protein n=1 Tax=Olea europaea subsp. europaea TaxID=158383 RepID=A0A8S0R4K8_OLEEU|nr:Hypothetical predicted protein [Olea europaea subsp. europaea]
MEAANEAKQLILKDNKTARLGVLKLDLASPKSVKAFANNFITRNLPFNILMTTYVFSLLLQHIRYSDKKAYGQSKLANILHATELSRRLQAGGANITVNSVHPGFENYKSLDSRDILLFSEHEPNEQYSDLGTATTCYVALHPSLKGVSGKYFVDYNEFKSSTFARDEDLEKRLWDFSNKLVDVAQNT